MLSFIDASNFKQVDLRVDMTDMGTLATPVVG